MEENVVVPYGGKNGSLKDQKETIDITHDSVDLKLRKIWIYSSGKKSASPSNARKPFNTSRLANGSASGSVSKLSVIEPRNSLEGSSVKLETPSKVINLPQLETLSPLMTYNKRKRVREADDFLRDGSPINGNADRAGRAPEQNMVRECLQRMSSDIMRYEIRLASLYGRLADLGEENKRLREEQTAFNELGARLVAETTNSESKDNENNNDKRSQVAKSVEDEEKENDYRKAYKRLKQLESRVIERLDEYKELTTKAEKTLTTIGEGRRDIQNESPFMADMKVKLIRLRQEISNVSNSKAVSVNNLKHALGNERLLRHNLEREMEETKKMAIDWRSFGQNAKEYIERLKKVVKSQQTIINSLREGGQESSELSMLKAEYAKSQRNLDIVQQHYTTLGKAYREMKEELDRIRISRKSFLDHINAQKADVQILSAKLDDERQTKKSLEDTIQRQRVSIECIASLVEKSKLAEFVRKVNLVPQKAQPSHPVQPITSSDRSVNKLDPNPSNQRQPTTRLARLQSEPYPGLSNQRQPRVIAPVNTNPSIEHRSSWTRDNRGPSSQLQPPARAEVYPEPSTQHEAPFRTEINSGPSNKDQPPSITEPNPTVTLSNLANTINNDVPRVKQESPTINLLSDQPSVTLESPTASRHLR